jgi:hypothetical protein
VNVCVCVQAQQEAQLAAELEEQRRAAQAREDQTRFRAAVQVQAVFIRLEVGHFLCFDEVADPCAVILGQHIMRDCAALRTRSEIEAKVGVVWCPQLASFFVSSVAMEAQD